MTPAPAHYKGRTRYTRTQAGRSITMGHESEMSLEPERAVLRYTSLETGDTVAIPVTERMAVYLLHQADMAMLRTARKHEEVDSIVKDATRTNQETPAPPSGYRWCPECLGCLTLSQTCQTCDGDRIVRDSIDAE